jgi:hypothetical protein
LSDGGVIETWECGYGFVGKSMKRINRDQAIVPIGKRERALKTKLCLRSPAMRAMIVCVWMIAGSAVFAEPVTTLDLDRGSFRAFLGWRTPAMISADGQLKPIPERRRKNLEEIDREAPPVRESARPPANWASCEFDDSDWTRIRGPIGVQASSEWDRVWVRGKFKVSDLAQVEGLRLKVDYLGGVIVYVNGVELTRGHLPQNEVKSRTFAEGYPSEAYLRPDGKLYGRRDGQEFADRLKVRVRNLTDEGVPVPPKMLRKGLNVIALESLGAPIAEAGVRAKPADNYRPPHMWAHAAILKAHLESAQATSVEPNLGPTADIAIANVPSAQTMLVGDYAHPGDGLEPVRLIGAKNGSFSGRVALSSTDTIRNLKAAASDLVRKVGAGKIPSSAIQIRWADAVRPDISWLPANRFDRLLSKPPTEVEPRAVRLRGQTRSPTPMAVVPVWITVHVPPNTSAGEYRGTVTIEARGTAAAKFAVPVEIKVCDWRIPDPGDFVVINNTYHSPDSVAQYYKVPLWSDKHFELMGQSLDILRQVGSRICILNLVVRAHSHGNTESMVRWIKQPDGTYKHDFTIVEKYMDLFEKTCGKPRIVQVNAWGFQGDTPDRPRWPPEGVTVMDKDGKRLEDSPQPPYGTQENEAFWRPVFVELRNRIEKRGWFDVTHVGWLSYCNAPSKDKVDVVQRIWPDARWIKNAHGPNKTFEATTGSMPVKYAGWVWGCGPLYDPDCLREWNKPAVYFSAGRRTYPRPWTSGEGLINLGIPRVGVSFTRPGLYDRSPLIRYRTVAEATLQGNVRGLAMVGGDFWPLPTGTDGRYMVICDNKGGVGPRNNTRAVISPGPGGPIFSERLEMLREGLQVAEAIVYLQKALEAKTVGDGLRRRIEAALDERARHYLRNTTPVQLGPGYDSSWMTLECTDWRDRDEQLFALAGELARG